MATFPLKDGATLSEADITAAVKSGGWGVKEIKIGDAIETLAALQFRVTGAKNANPGDLVKAVTSELKDAKEVWIDTGGVATVVMKSGVAAPADASPVVKALKSVNAEYGVADFQSQKWPATVAAYIVKVPGMKEPADAAKVRDALRGMGKIIAVQVFEDRKIARILLNEPCSKIAGEVTAALDLVGYEAKVLEPKDGAKPKEPAKEPAKDAPPAKQ